jgi:hypothetical protein
MMSSADLNANIPSHTNQPTQLFIQKLFNTKAKIDGEEHEQCFHPSSFCWVLHILTSMTGAAFSNMLRLKMLIISSKHLKV